MRCVVSVSHVGAATHFLFRAGEHGLAGGLVCDGLLLLNLDVCLLLRSLFLLGGERLDELLHVEVGLLEDGQLLVQLRLEASDERLNRAQLVETPRKAAQQRQERDGTVRKEGSRDEVCERVRGERASERWRRKGKWMGKGEEP